MAQQRFQTALCVLLVATICGALPVGAQSERRFRASDATATYGAGGQSGDRSTTLYGSLTGTGSSGSAKGMQQNGKSASTTPLFGSAYTVDPELHLQKAGALRSGVYERHRFARGTARSARFDAMTSDGKLSAKTRQLLFKAFANMTCIEYNQLGANYYTAEHNYRPVELMETVDLPGFWGSSVQVFSDGKHYLAIDPRTADSWVTEVGSDVTSKKSWRKLLHVK